MNVFIIPEDFRNDQYILKASLHQAVSQGLGFPSTTVVVCQNPLLGGVGEALKSERLAAIVERRRGWTDVFILCVDRDGVTGRRQRLDQLENEFNGSVVFLGENAWEEIETWVLAGLDLPREWRWADVRAEVNVKEVYFEALVAQRGLDGTPGGGRKALGDDASRKINTIRQKCPEDFESLAKRLEALV